MELTWLGHACFRLRSREATIVTDPYEAGSGYPTLKLTANIVTVSHADPRHSAAAAIGGSPRVIDRPGEYEIAGVPIIGVRTYRDREKGATLGKNVSFVFTVEDMQIGHLGNLGHVPNAEQAEALTGLDVLLIPVGGRVTLDAKLAAETISLLQPRLVVPMHFATPREKEDLDGIDRFLREMGLAAAEPQPRLSVTKSSLPDSVQVVVLAPPS
ncbi:MAG: Zn-dependent hydrolase [Dehalococcoidia bacterium]|jgi:L-ascorbate metabolism protein UlaG (beta-lactamase superfamily)|nr:MAG: Zn-dependent hydrolase [Dehalococcoidia bacterium]